MTRSTRRRFLGSVAAFGATGLFACASDDAENATGPTGGGQGGDGTGGGGTGGGGGAGGGDPGVPLGEIVLVSWRDSQQPLTWIYPRADGDSEAHWRHRRTPAGIRWTIPLGVVGGGYPYNFEIISGPPGLTVFGVGFDTGRPPFYYYLSLDAPEVGSYPISIRATDQNGAQVTQTWTLEVLDASDTSAFLFFDSATGDNDNPGTPAAPKRDIAGWYNGDEDDAAFQLHQCFYQGTFDVGGVSGVEYDGEGQRMPVGDSKPRTHVGHGAGATWRGNGSYWHLADGTGFYIADLTYEDPAVPEGGGTRNQHFRCGNSSLANGAIFRITFRGSGQASSEGSNSSCIQLANPVGTDARYCFVGCTADGVTEQALLQNYNGLDGLLEGWTVQNCDGVSIVHQKGGDIRRWVTRGIAAVDNNTNCRFAQDEWIADPVAREDLEICWCSFTSTSYGRVLMGGGALGDTFARIDSYRNNWRIDTHELRDVTTGVITFEDDIIQHSGAFEDGIRSTGDDFSATITKTDLVTGTSNLLDPATNLRVGGPDGEHGCEMVFVDQR